MFCLILLIVCVVFLEAQFKLVPLKLRLYVLPLNAILMYHNIGYHVYADDTQL